MESPSNSNPNVYHQAAESPWQALRYGTWNLISSTWHSSPESAWKARKYQLLMDNVLKQVEDRHEESEAGEKLHVEAKELLALLQPLTDDPRNKYKKYLNRLREIIESKPFEEANEFDVNKGDILNHAYYLFTANYNYPFSKSTISNILQMSDTTLCSPLDAQFKAIGRAPVAERTTPSQHLFSKFRGASNYGFDPHSQGNLPYAAFRFKLNKEVAVLRFGTPTMESTYLQNAKITPEFRVYLLYLKTFNKKHLYVNLQARQSISEASRCKAITNLRKDFPETIYIVTLDNDSKWYKQENQYEKLDHFEAFKEEFIKQLLSKESSYEFPEKWTSSPYFTSALDHCFSCIHKAMGEKGALSRDERLIFIELFHTLLTLRILEVVEADYINMSCKDAIDRGGKELTKLFDLLTKYQGDSRDEERNVMMHAAAFFAKKREILPSRANRLCAALAFLSSLSNERLQEMCGKLVDKTFKVSTESPYPMRVEEVLSTDDFSEIE